MNYEKALRNQKLRFEVGRAKKEVEFYEEQVDELKRRKRKQHIKTTDSKESGEGIEKNHNKQEQEAEDEERDAKLASRSGHYSKRQKLTDEEIRASKKSQKGAAPEVDLDLISSIFS